MKLLLSASATQQRMTLLTTMLLVFLGAAAQAQTPARRSGRDVHLRIETDRATYRLGQPIAIRLTLRNVASAPVRYITQPPVALANLRVYDAQGRLVATAFPPAAQDLPSGRPVTLPARGATTLTWLGKEWLNLRDWGYDLRNPGRYTITGLPGVVSTELTPDYQTVRSNRATFTITP